MTSISNFMTFLGNAPRKQSPEAAATSSTLRPGDIRILQAALKADLLPTAGLATLIGLSTDDIADAVERLRALNQIELVENKDARGTFYLRLTSGGYQTLKTI